MKRPIFHVLHSKDELVPLLDEIATGLTKAIARAGGYGDSPQFVLNLVCRMVENPDAFLLAALDDEGRLVSFTLALCAADRRWVHVIIMWSKVGYASRYANEGIEILRKWAKSLGVENIVTFVTRSPEHFFEFFYEPLGFKKAGLILEAPV